MEIFKYNDYLLEKFIYQCILESRVIYSSDFLNILKRMSDNEIASQLIKLNRSEVDGLVQNYIDISDAKDEVVFTPDRKAKEIIGDSPEIWKVIEPNRRLTSSLANWRLFNILGYDPSKTWQPHKGSLGTIVSETDKTITGNVYVLFKKIDGEECIVINKSAIEYVDNEKIWQTSRNKIKIGRFTRTLLKSVGVEVGSELERFINLYKSTYDVVKDKMKQFDVVSGDDIKYWYFDEQYVSGDGTLNNSCMADVGPEFFEIYSRNDVSLVILYSDGGEIDEKTGKYKSNKIKGRALLWNATKGDGSVIKFMDRVYTVQDSDVDLFIQYARSNGWWYKKIQNSIPNASISNGKKSITDPSMFVKLKQSEFEYYPYCDTFCYLVTDYKILSNEMNDDTDKELRDTDGSFISTISDDYWS